jgi:hypothetical protein
LSRREFDLRFERERFSQETEEDRLQGFTRLSGLSRGHHFIYVEVSLGSCRALYGSSRGHTEARLLGFAETNWFECLRERLYFVLEDLH